MPLSARSSRQVLDICDEESTSGGKHHVGSIDARELGTLLALTRLSQGRNPLGSGCEKQRTREELLDSREFTSDN